MTFSISGYAQSQETTMPHKAQELIIKFKTEPSQDVLQQMATAVAFTNFKHKLVLDHHFEMVEAYDWAKLIHVRALPFDNLQKVIEDLEKLPEVEYAEPNYIFGLDVSLDALELSVEKGRSAETRTIAGDEVVHEEAPLVESPSDSQVVVAVIDTGVAYDHPDLVPHMWTNTAEIPANGIDDDANGYIDDVLGWDFSNGDNDPYDDHYHGTHVAGIVTSLQNPGDAVIKIMPLKFLSAGGYGTTGDAIRAIDYAVKNGAKILNNSWGGGTYSRALLDAIVASYDANTVFVVAAGNSSLNIDQDAVYPPSYLVPNEVSVAALDSSDNLTWFSNYGPTTVHVGALGQSVYSTLPKERCDTPPCYGYLSGTSMAAPYVSGVAAMILSKNSELMHLQVKEIIMNTSISNAKLEGKIGQGSVSADDAYLLAQNTEPSSDIPPYVPQSIGGAIGLTSDRSSAGVGGCAAAFLDSSSSGGGRGPTSVSLCWPLLFVVLWLRMLCHRRRKFVLNPF
ncbi:MAG: S8 family serine peptidase [Deltaproteobacteria bacterium]|nr:S8 family serine peptidase [Deltaproteobacteria bacterium]